LTIEDPVEYEVRGITQIQVHPKIELTFAQGLRSMLRHDPDVMMVGEVRDYDTAEIAIRAALTGHLVFSTLHTNDAAGAVTRLIDMGVEPFLVASSVECLIAQRLVRLICTKCKTRVLAKTPLLAQLGIHADHNSVEIYEGKGCEACKMTGYRGRTAIYEFLVMSDPVRELVLKSASSAEVKRKAVSLGMRTLREDGWEKVQMGLTTVAEVIRVAQEDSPLQGAPPHP
jgi:type II secretory ATPase GspE/PulE/Tfp pilus assembly ATPase PilB-like protein